MRDGTDEEGDDDDVPKMFPVGGLSREDFGEEPGNLELVRCEAFIRLAALDPKVGTFRVRMKCVWAFRTHNSREDAELHLRGVPGIRMPGLLDVVEESRVWKDLTFSGSARTTGSTVLWRGISLFTMDGFKAFEMSQFPFDRHILNLERLEFVWRPEKDDADYYKSMKLAYLDVKTSSMLPEWRVMPAYVKALNVQEPVAGSKSFSHASKFTMQLRIERKVLFYSWQVFVVTYLITILSCFPLGMNPEQVGDRLAIFVAGMLTLVAFKYGVSDHLPSVPYQTFTDRFLLAQIMTVFFCGILSVVSYRILDIYPETYHWVDWTENALGMLMTLGWTLTLLLTVGWRMDGEDSCKTRDSWKRIVERDEKHMDKWRQEEEDRLRAHNAMEMLSSESPLAGVSAEEFKSLGLTEEQEQRISQLQAARGLVRSGEKGLQAIVPVRWEALADRRARSARSV